MIVNNIIAEGFVRGFGGRFLDKDNISWKIVDNKWIGKRSVWTFDFRACWLEETQAENVKSWWCGKTADYSEIFNR